ncbi:MAG: bifunctional glutamate N-acetyltransferase/amino-acid acetyltransferase ArgJ [Bacteroidetes bacterium]|nr:bifunctional glutamate N-acetyltransferase/amino-acid acetyltransferase ArgJ [Bacteroidota bacterium]MBU1113797.1 bifunctional glutamate N-acetyltransferase/amino-acid acetyltransferase ArgJ [Bacteroidota bacterium]MBU1798293.1 bifunctional glutamate N-acetyltransferase/amino-acid acetyltransferase ArgJ [Bacteroidota bacterium]
MFKFIENGSVTSVAGIKASGIHAGIKRKRKDLALIVSDEPCNVAGTFTLNKVKAAPLLVSQELINKGGKVRAILVNSGNANACTGDRGLSDALESQKYCAEKLGIDQSEVVISSTGVIGQYMPMHIIKTGINSIIGLLNYTDGIKAAKAIMTTDLVEKSFAVKVQLTTGEVTIGGIAKGSGMIMPNMATMLSFMTTDAEIETNFLKKLLLNSVNNSFNKISVDGDTSTNDMVVLMANGVSKIKVEENTENEELFFEALQAISIELAKMIVVDGEGATKLIEIAITGCNNDDDANTIARSISNSPLVKTAIYGSDANWGRILSAVGKSGVDFDPSLVEIKFDDMVILGKNYEHEFDEEEATVILSKKEIKISVNLNAGSGSSTWWTCDFTENYIKINATYRS